MLLVPRQVVGSLTAAFVLLCHVLCACGGAPAAATHPDAADGSARLTSCHGGHGGDEGHCPEKKGQPEAPEPVDHSSCQHCERPAASVSEKGKSLDDLRPTALPAGLAAPSWSVGLVAVIPDSHLRFAARDLPPPGISSTLLSLHCALNT